MKKKDVKLQGTPATWSRVLFAENVYTRSESVVQLAREANPNEPGWPTVVRTVLVAKDFMPGPMFRSATRLMHQAPRAQ